MRWIGLWMLCAGCSARHVVDVTWSFVDVATGEHTGCPPDFPYAEVHVQRTTLREVSSLSGGRAWGRSGEDVHEVYPCTDFAGPSPVLEPGQPSDETFGEAFLITVEITDGADRRYATSLPAVAFDDAERASVTIANDGGHFAFNLVDHYGVWSWCDGARALRINLQGEHGVAGEIIDCSWGFPVRRPGDGLGRTYLAAHPAGTYDVWLDALDESWQPLRDSDRDHVPDSPSGFRSFRWEGVVLEPRNQVTSLSWR